MLAKRQPKKHEQLSYFVAIKNRHFGPNQSIRSVINNVMMNNASYIMCKYDSTINLNFGDNPSKTMFEMKTEVSFTGKNMLILDTSKQYPGSKGDSGSAVTNDQGQLVGIIVSGHFDNSDDDDPRQKRWERLFGEGRIASSICIANVVLYREWIEDCMKRKEEKSL